jgi:hypothetical protein
VVSEKTNILTENLEEYNSVRSKQGLRERVRAPVNKFFFAPPPPWAPPPGEVGEKYLTKKENKGVEVPSG